MKYVSSKSYELEDMKLAARQLLEPLEGFKPEGKSLGILFYDDEIDVSALIAELKKTIDFDLVGSSVQGLFESEAGMDEFCTALFVMSDESVTVDVYVSEPVTPQNIDASIGELCGRMGTKEEIFDKTKVIICNAPFISGVILDDYPDGFGRYAGGVPFFGGVSSYNSSRNYSSVIYNDSEYRDRFVVICLGGGIKPVFSIGSNISADLKRKRLVTKAEGATIYKVGDMTFVEYLQSVGIGVAMPKEHTMEILLASVTLNVTMPDEANDGVAVYRSVYSINMEDGSGVALGRVPEGSYICAATYKSNDIEVSAKDCLDKLFDGIEKAKAKGYEHSVILCASCNGRYMFMYPTKDIEAKLIKERMPKSFGLAGFYTFGEFCPTSVRDGVAVNRAHNATLTMCAL